MHSNQSSSKAGVFLDRDGVIIDNVADYVRRLTDIRFIPGALTALARLGKTEYRIAIVSNQSAVGRGVIRADQAVEIQQAVVEEIQSAGGRIDGSYLCFHKPADQCNCRKPKPGLILQAANELGLDLNTSILIGDAASDVRAALSAGVGEIALVRTGRGERQLGLLSSRERSSIKVYPNLAQAVDNLTN